MTAAGVLRRRGSQPHCGEDRPRRRYGGAGFVGSHLCDRLLAEGWSVVCVDSLLTGNRDNIASSTGDRSIQLRGS